MQLQSTYSYILCFIESGLQGCRLGVPGQLDLVYFPAKHETERCDAECGHAWAKGAQYTTHALLYIYMPDETIMYS